MQKNILIIEDDKSILDATQMALELEGYVVTTADRGAYVNKLISGAVPIPDCILLDILLSGMDGRMICKKIKDAPLTRNVPVIIMSAHPGVEKSAQEAGADHFLPKPFNIEELLSTVKKLA